MIQLEELNINSTYSALADLPETKKEYIIYLPIHIHDPIYYELYFNVSLGRATCYSARSERAVHIYISNLTGINDVLSWLRVELYYKSLDSDRMLLWSCHR